METWMGEGCDNKTWESDEMLDFIFHRYFIREETHWLLMGVQDQVQGRWCNWQVHDMVGCKRFSKHEGINYEETFAPTIKMNTIWLVLAMAVQFG